jgi:tRNA (guanine-N7-)-methyltransferase
MSTLAGKKTKQKEILSFVKRQGRKLSDSKKKLLEELLPKIEIKTIDDSDDNLVRILTMAKEGRRIIFEIGYGAGENLFNLAKNNPDDIFIGCEVFITGVAKLLKNIDEHSINNIYLFNGDAISLLEYLPDDFLSKLYLLFPDPWPKAKHHKRRIVNNKNIELFANKLKSKSDFLIATDHEDYASWIAAHIINDKSFDWLCDNVRDWHNEPEDWVETKYQKKSKKAGSRNYFFTLSLS